MGASPRHRRENPIGYTVGEAGDAIAGDSSRI